MSLAEKCRLTEQPETAARRALREELGIQVAGDLSKSEAHTETRQSRSYPGLISCYDQYYFTYWMTMSEYRPEGYVEKQPDKDTFFGWRALTEN